MLNNRNQLGFGLFEFVIASALGTLLCLGIFTLLDAMQILYRKQTDIVQLQEKMRFATLFLRQKIQSAGDWSCEPDANRPNSIAIQRYTAEDALQTLGISIKPETNLLQLHECTRFQDKLHYLPVDFFIANTSRLDEKHQQLEALFFEISGHPREELITGMTDFQVHLYTFSKKINSTTAVKINYLLSLHGLNQPGILYVAQRNSVL